MATMAVTVGYRPVRIGWCIRPDNLDDLRKALRLTYTLWGGRFNPLIPVGSRLDKTLVKSFQVDVLVAASQDSDLLQFVQSFDELYWPERQHTVFPRGSDSPNFIDVKTPLQLIRQKRENLRTALPQAYTFQSTQGNPLNDVFLAMFGSYPTKGDVGTDYTRLFCTNLNGEPTDSTRKPGITTAITPADVASWDLEALDRQFIFEGQNGIYMGSAESAADLVTFWNLRAAGLNLRFLDRAHADELLPFTTDWLSPLIERSRSGRQEDLVGVWSKSESEFDHKPDTGEWWVLKLIDEDYWLRLPVLHHYHWNQERVLGSFAIDSSPRYSFLLPEKPVPKDTNPLQNVGVTVRLHGDLNESAKDTFFVPGIPKLNMIFSPRMYYPAPFATRVARDYFTLCISTAVDYLNIPAINKPKLISELFQVYGISAELSQPGIVAMRLIDQMGGLHGCESFRFPGVRNLIEKFTPLQHFTRAAAIQFIRDLDSTGKSLFGDYPAPGSKQTPHSVFDALLDRRIFRAGLEFRCPNCHLPFWMPIDSIKTDIPCDLCGVNFNCMSQLKDRGDWRFRRSGLFGKDDHQEGSIPVVLTLRQLSNSVGRFSMQPFVFTTAMKLNPGSASIPPCETDFVFLTRDFPSPYSHVPLNLVIGECKSAGGEITETDLHNLSAVAAAIDPKELSVFLLLAKTGAFSADEIARCKRAAARLPGRVILLSDRELDAPNFVYEWSARQFNVMATPITLEDMARDTDVIFFNPQPKP